MAYLVKTLALLWKHRDLRAFAFFSLALGNCIGVAISLQSIGFAVVSILGLFIFLVLIIEWMEAHE